MCVIVLGKEDKEFTLSPQKKADDKKLASSSTSVSSANPPTSISSVDPASLPTDSHAAAATSAESSAGTADGGGTVPEWSYENNAAEMKVAPRSE